MDILRKLQNLPKHIRKIILWFAVMVLGFGFLFWWAENLQKRFEGFSREKFIEELNLPELEMPEVPEISKKELKELESLMEKIQETKSEK